MTERKGGRLTAAALSIGRRRWKFRPSLKVESPRWRLKRVACAASREFPSRGHACVRSVDIDFGVTGGMVSTHTGAQNMSMNYRTNVSETHFASAIAHKVLKLGAVN